MKSNSRELESVKSLLQINRPNQVKRKKIDWIEEPVPPDHPQAMI